MALCKAAKDLGLISELTTLSINRPKSLCSWRRHDSILMIEVLLWQPMWKTVRLPALELGSKKTVLSRGTWNSTAGWNMEIAENSLMLMESISSRKLSNLNFLGFVFKTGYRHRKAEPKAKTSHGCLKIRLTILEKCEDSDKQFRLLKSAILRRMVYFSCKKYETLRQSMVLKAPFHLRMSSWRLSSM